MNKILSIGETLDDQGVNYWVDGTYCDNKYHIGDDTDYNYLDEQNNLTSCFAYVVDMYHKQGGDPCKIDGWWYLVKFCMGTYKERLCKYKERHEDDMDEFNKH